jgi:hypothetical protein
MSKQDAKLLLHKTKILQQQVKEFIEKELPNREQTNDGLSKYVNKINMEIKFLERISASEEPLNASHIVCSNYPHLHGLYQLITSENCLYVFKAFHTGKEVVRVDLVADNGSKWIKLKKGGINYELRGYEFEDEEEESSDDSNSQYQGLQLPEPLLVRQARKIAEAAKANLFHFKPPRVIYKFIGPAPVSDIIRGHLQSLGVEIEHGFSPEKTILPRYHYLTNVLNLDIPTLLALVSDISYRLNEINTEAFDSKPLKLQYAEESIEPIMPKLDQILKGRDLVCTLSAFEKFKAIVEKIGGPSEKSRAAYLFDTSSDNVPKSILNISKTIHSVSLKVVKGAFDLPYRIFIVPNNPSPEYQKITTQIKITSCNIDVFGTAFNLKISTVTSNGALQRSLEKTGLGNAIVLHQPRGLIEQKWLRYSSMKVN